MPRPNRQQTNRTRHFTCVTSRLIFKCDSSDETKNCLFVSKPVGHTHVLSPGQIRCLPILVPECDSLAIKISLLKRDDLSLNKL